MQKQIKQEKFKELLRLMEEYPDLPVVPMVEGEVVSGDKYSYSYWMGNWSSAVLKNISFANSIYGSVRYF